MSKHEVLVLDATAAEHRPVTAADQFDAATSKLVTDAVAASGISADAGNQIVVGTDGKLKVAAAPTPTFLALNDAPHTYAGQAGKLVAVNAAANAVEFIPVPPTGVSTDAGNQLHNGTDSKPFFQQVVTSLAYDAVTTKLTFTDEAGHSTVVDLSALTSDIYVNGATFDPASLVLTLKDNTGATPDITIDLSTLHGKWTDNGNGTYTYDSGNGTKFTLDLRASNLRYDHTASGLAAGTVQAAIDELDTNADTLKARVDNLTAAQVTYDHAASGLAATTAQAAIDEVEARVDALEGAQPSGTPNTMVYYDAAGAPTSVPLAPGYLNVSGLAQAPAFEPVPIPATVRRTLRLQEHRRSYGPAFAAISNFDEIVTAGTRTNGVMNAGSQDRGLPILQPVGGLNTGQWSKVWATSYNIYALTTTGELWVKGYNVAGQLGLGDTTLRQVLTKVPGVVVTDLAISGTIDSGTIGDSQYVIAWNNLTGQAWGWGDNAAGQLGDGTTTRRSAPVALNIPGFTAANPIKQVTLGGQSSAAPAGQCSFVLLNDGKLLFAGSGATGRLGNGATANVLNWTLSAQSGVSKVVTSAQYYNAATPGWEGNGFSAILQNGTIKTTGYNASGQLGDGTTTQRTSWVTPAGTFQGSVVDIGCAGGSSGSIWVLTSTGEIWLVGNNANGKLGDGTTTARSSFIKPAGAFQGKVAKVVSAAAGHPGTLLIDTDGNCWYAGDGGEGQAGDGMNVATHSTFQRIYLPVEGTGVTVVDAMQQTSSTTASTIYLLLSDGRVFSGGNNTNGMLGIGEPTGTFYFFQEMKLQ